MCLTKTFNLVVLKYLPSANYAHFPNMVTYDIKSYPQMAIITPPGLGDAIPAVGTIPG